jgi:hypothetical protein
MSWRGGAVSSRNGPQRAMARTAASSNLLPGYQVFQGRILLHARHLGTPADARSSHRPWHVVGRTMQELVEAVQRGR